MGCVPPRTSWKPNPVTISSCCFSEDLILLSQFLIWFSKPCSVGLMRGDLTSERPWPEGSRTRINPMKNLRDILAPCATWGGSCVSSPSRHRAPEGRPDRPWRDPVPPRMHCPALSNCTRWPSLSLRVGVRCARQRWTCTHIHIYIYIYLCTVRAPVW